MFTLHVYATNREYGDGEDRPMVMVGEATGYATVGDAIEAAKAIADRDDCNVMVFDLGTDTVRGWVWPTPTADDIMHEETGMTADERAWIG